MNLHRVAVYWNSTRKCFSVRRASVRGVRHIKSAWLYECVFRVWPGGQERARRTGRKNVHAFVRGIRMPNQSTVASHWPPGSDIRYNLYHDAGFTRVKTGEIVTHAAWVHLSCTGGWPRVIAYGAA